VRSTLNEVLAKRLRQLAEEKGLPLSHVADRAGMAHSFFWKLLAAESSATLTSVERLAEVLGVDPLELLTEGGGAVAKRPGRRKAASRPARKE
jgi:transcriptional regulator with XRE-family HTH domain